MAFDVGAPGRAWLLIKKGAEPGSVFDLEQDVITMGDSELQFVREAA